MSDSLHVSRQEIVDGRWERILNFFRSRSLWMLYYCTGCGAIELPPSMTSRFDLERFGIGPMATPRQADILLITGYISLKTLKRVVRSYEQMPEPKWVVGFGSCPVNGGIYWDSYATINHLEKYIPVDVSIAGCMPRPQAVIDGLQKLMRLIQRGEAVGYKKYQLNHQWYKDNQRAVLERTAPVLGAEPAGAKPAAPAAEPAAARGAEPAGVAARLTTRRAS
jgi:NADH-quinone oxidoreductase subunit B